MNAGLQGFPAEHCILMRSVSTFNDAAAESPVHLILSQEQHPGNLNLFISGLMLAALQTGQTTLKPFRLPNVRLWM